MKGDAGVVQYLNVVLRNELTAINQYFLHARMLKNWGITKLGAHEYDESIDEMKHADRLIERILFLDGIPNVKLGKIFLGDTVTKILECDLRLEQEAISQLREAITHCTNVQDFVSRELLIAILESEEEQVDFLETQSRLIEQMGLQNYVQLQSEPPD
jgi:bacterioferritin